jgi:protein-L-isoaspartate O-methyltransferase
MCKGVRAIINDYRRQPQPVLVYPPQSKTFGQEPTPPEVVNEMVDNLLLRPSDTLMDLGCGDGRILIAAVRNSGCRAVGIELDPLKAAEARTRVEAAGLSSRIKVVTGDALAFDPRAYGATVLTAFLYPELLEKLKPKFSQVDRFATPYHQVPGLAMVKFGEVWYGPS